MGVPTGAVEEARVVGEFDKADAILNEAASKDAALAEFALVAIAEVGGFGVEVEVFHEAGTGEAEGFALCFLVVGERGVWRGGFFESGEEFFAGGDTVAAEEVRLGESGWAGFEIGEVDVAVAGAEESGSPADIWETDEHVGRGIGICRAALVGHDGTEGGISRGAAGRASGVEKVGGNSVLIDDLVVAGADGGDLLHAAGELGKVFANTDTFDSGVDRGVVGSGLVGFFRTPLFLGVEGVDL